jgi:hypothetical protein
MQKRFILLFHSDPSFRKIKLFSATILKSNHIKKIIFGLPTGVSNLFYATACSMNGILCWILRCVFLNEMSFFLKRNTGWRLLRRFQLINP